MATIYKNSMLIVSSLPYECIDIIGFFQLCIEATETQLLMNIFTKKKLNTRSSNKIQLLLIKKHKKRVETRC